MKVICGNTDCRARLSIDESKAKETQEFIKFRCPVCQRINKVTNPCYNEGKSPENADGLEELDKEVGWLVVHDENTQQQTYALKPGKNIVGRKSVSRPCGIMIESDDTYLSRNHFAVEVEKGRNGYDYLVYDVTSTNGTIINADKNRKLNIQDKVLLNDGDTIQAGRTKIVLKTKKVAGNAKVATDTVISNKPLKTVIF